MGTMRHHGIIVTSSDPVILQAARRTAIELAPETPLLYGPFAGLVSEILPGITNNYGTFVIAPDGSKEEFGASERSDRWRSQFVAWLEAQAHDDGSSPLDWVEVQFGDTRCETLVLRDSDARRREGWPATF